MNLKSRKLLIFETEWSIVVVFPSFSQLTIYLLL
jgi:hypothetical protein